MHKDVLTLEQPNKQNNHNLEKKPELRKVIPIQKQKYAIRNFAVSSTYWKHKGSWSYFRNSREMLSITKVPAKSAESLDDDHYLQYRRASDGTYVFDGDMRATPERYDRKAQPWEEADDIWADP